jgi:hypothetical protein
MHVLGAEDDAQPIGLDHRLNGAKRGEGRGHHHLDPVVIRMIEPIGQLLHHLDRLQMAGIHLPVPDDQVFTISHA